MIHSVKVEAWAKLIYVTEVKIVMTFLGIIDWEAPSGRLLWFWFFYNSIFVGILHVCAFFKKLLSWTQKNCALYCYLSPFSLYMYKYAHTYVYIIYTCINYKCSKITSIKILKLSKMFTYNTQVQFISPKVFYCLRKILLYI